MVDLWLFVCRDVVILNEVKDLAYVSCKRLCEMHRSAQHDKHA